MSHAIVFVTTASQSKQYWAKFCSQLHWGKSRVTHLLLLMYTSLNEVGPLILETGLY